MAEDNAELAARSFFESAGEGKIDALLKQPDRFFWEAQQCSQFSPGPVLDRETLCRQLAHPIFIDRETGVIKPPAFNDVFQHGMSVEREEHWSEEDAVGRAEKRASAFNAAVEDPNKKRTFVAFGVLSAGAVRQCLTLEGVNSLGVFDTALQDVPAHADVCMLAEKSDLNKRRVRAHLQEIVSARFVEIPD